MRRPCALTANQATQKCELTQTRRGCLATRVVWRDLATSDAELLAQQAVDLGAVRTPLGLAHDRADEGADRLRVPPAHALGDHGVGVDDARHDGGELVGVPDRAEALALDHLLRIS